MPLTAGVNAFLVPSKWLDTWRDYVGATGKTLDVIGEPPPLEEAVAAVFCKHGELAVRPPELLQRKNDLVQEQKVGKKFCLFYALTRRQDLANIEEFLPFSPVLIVVACDCISGLTFFVVMCIWCHLDLTCSYGLPSVC